MTEYFQVVKILCIILESMLLARLLILWGNARYHGYFFGSLILIMGVISLLEGMTAFFVIFLLLAIIHFVMEWFGAWRQRWDESEKGA